MSSFKDIGEFLHNVRGSYRICIVGDANCLRKECNILILPFILLNIIIKVVNINQSCCL